MHKTRVVLTVDTEPSIAGAMNDPIRFPPLLEEPVWGEVNGRSEALGFITRTLGQYDLRATFFVETVHTRHFGPQLMRRCTDHLLKYEQDVQLHIHPVWKNFSKPAPTKRRYNDDSTELDEAELTALIREGCDQIELWTGARPVAMRTGNFSANPAVYEAMARAGLSLASNICVACVDYDHAVLRHAGGIHIINGIHELPASCFIDPGPVGRGRYRSAQITACSARELIDILNQCTKQSVDTLVLVTHPFEYLKVANFRYGNLRPNRLVQRRLDRLCRFLSDNPDRFEVTTFGALATQLPLHGAAAPLLKSAVAKSLERAAQNFINDRI